VDPVAAPHRLIEEIRKGNFEPTLSGPGQGSGFSTVISAGRRDYSFAASGEISATPGGVPYPTNLDLASAAGTRKS